MTVTHPKFLRIGVIVPFDFCLDREYWRYISEPLSLHLTRTHFHAGPVGRELAAAVGDEQQVAQATRDLLVIEPRIIAYACTSGSFIHGVDGERRLVECMIDAGAPAAITTSGALVDALRFLTVSTVSIGTPYDAELTRLLARFLGQANVTTVKSVSLGMQDHISDLSSDDVVRLAEAADHPGADAIFLSCTNLPTFGLVSELESRLGKPVLTANQVTMWAALRAIGQLPGQVDDRIFVAARSLPSTQPTGG